MDMAPVERADAAGCMNVPAESHGNGWPGEAADLMQVNLSEVSGHFKGMNVIIVANGDDLASHASKAVIVGYLSEDHGAALDFVDMGLGGNDCLGGFRGEVVQYNPSFAFFYRNMMV